MPSIRIMAAACSGIFLLSLASCADREAPEAAPKPAGDPRADSNVKHEGDREKDQRTNATPIVVRETALTFDPKTCLRGMAGFGWGLGTVQVNVLGREAGHCIFDFTNEIEGGYQVYRCRVPVDGPPVKIFAANGGIETSFPLEEAKVIRSGNLLLGTGDAAKKPSLKPKPVPDTDYVIYLVADVVAGKGDSADRGDHVKIRATVYADEYFDTKYIGIESTRPLEFTLGDGQVGPSLETAVQGMKEGGKRRVLMRQEVAPKISEMLGGVQPHTVLAVEIELVNVE